MSLRNRRAHRAACLALLTAFSSALLPFTVQAQDATIPDPALESQPSAAGAIATDDHWSLAETIGDTAFLDQFLLPEYRSVGNDGKVYSKRQLVAGAAKRSGTDMASARRTLAAYRKAHPHGTTTVMRGNLAILSFYDPALGPQKGVTSSDVLIYVDGHWHAIYSQHTGKSH